MSEIRVLFVLVGGREDPERGESPDRLDRSDGLHADHFHCNTVGIVREPESEEEDSAFFEFM